MGAPSMPAGVHTHTQQDCKLQKAHHTLKTHSIAPEGVRAVSGSGCRQDMPRAVFAHALKLNGCTQHACRFAHPGNVNRSSVLKEFQSLMSLQSADKCKAVSKEGGQCTGRVCIREGASLLPHKQPSFFRSKAYWLWLWMLFTCRTTAALISVHPALHELV